MTRSAISLLHLDLAASLAWHPMLIPTLILAILYLGIGLWKKNCQCQACQVLLWIWIVAMLGCWIYRLIFVFPNSPLWN